MLSRHRPTTVGVATVRIGDVADAELQLTVGVGVKAADVEIVAIGVVFLEDAVLARKGVAVLQAANFNVFNTGTRSTLVPVIEVGNVDVIPLVEAPTGPQRAVVKRRDVAPFGVRLHQARKAMVAGELGCVIVFVVQRSHALNAQDRPVVHGEQVLTQPQLGVLLALVPQSELGRCARQLEAGLRFACRRFANTTAHIAVEVQCLRSKRHSETGQRDCEAYACRFLHIHSN